VKSPSLLLWEYLTSEKAFLALVGCWKPKGRIGPLVRGSSQVSILMQSKNWMAEKSGQDFGKLFEDRAPSHFYCAGRVQRQNLWGSWFTLRQMWLPVSARENSLTWPVKPPRTCGYPQLKKVMFGLVFINKIEELCGMRKKEGHWDRVLWTKPF
jgi:hypothetical protein